MQRSSPVLCPQCSGTHLHVAGACAHGGAGVGWPPSMLLGLGAGVCSHTACVGVGCIRAPWVLWLLLGLCFETGELSACNSQTITCPGAAGPKDYMQPVA